METQLQTQSSNVPATTKMEGGSNTLDASDIRIPRLHLLQPTSDGVGDEFNIGDIVHTNDQVAVGGKGTPVQFLPFHIAKVNVKKTAPDGGEREYICTEDFDPAREWEEEGYVWSKRDGTTETVRIRNYKTFIVHGIVCGGDDEVSLPVSVTFQSSAGKGVRPLVSHFATVQQFNALRGSNNKPHTVVWDLASDQVKEPGKNYAVWTMKKSRKATKEEIEECDQWALALSRNLERHLDHSQVEVTHEDAEQPTIQAKPVQQENIDDLPF